MASLKPVLALVAAIAFAGAFAPAHAEPESPVSAVASAACDGLSASDADRLAREAEQNGEYQRAADCFLVAGKPLRAHRASVRAAGETAAAAKRNASIAAETSKLQARRIRAAFR